MPAHPSPAWLSPIDLEHQLASAPLHMVWHALNVARGDTLDAVPCSWSLGPAIHCSAGFGGETRLAETVAVAAALTGFAIPAGAIVLVSGHKGCLAVFWASAPARQRYAPFIARAWTLWAGEESALVQHFVVAESLLLLAQPAYYERGTP